MRSLLFPQCTQNKWVTEPWKVAKFGSTPAPVLSPRSQVGSHCERCLYNVVAKDVCFQETCSTYSCRYPCVSLLDIRRHRLRAGSRGSCRRELSIGGCG